MRRLSLLIGSTLAVLLPFFIAARFRVVVAPLLAVLAAHALVSLVRWRRNDLARFRRWVAVAAVLSFCTHLYVIPAVEIASRCAEFYDRGLADVRRGDFETASLAFRSALQANPNHVQSWGNLGACLLNLGYVDESIACFERALALAPEDPRLMPLLDLARRRTEALP